MPDQEFNRELTPLDSPEANGLRPFYEKSWAVVIGIDGYRNVRKLEHAVHDAAGMAKLLVERLGFARENVFVVLDPPPPEPLPFDLHSDTATKAVIEELLFTHLPDMVGPDDRLLFFFAGHGERRRLATGKTEIGYLAPVDANHDAWHTFVEMDAVVRAGNFCRAKHVFYILDACYSGLATGRADVQPSRYATDMLTNRARQALTAGTAKQVVTDRGPDGHSLFTSYLIEGLRGAANLNPEADDAITASELMVYVKNRVASDSDSEQTPDFGTLLGHESGGDFVFMAPEVELTPEQHFETGKLFLRVGKQLGEAALVSFGGKLVARANDLAPAVCAWKGDSLRAHGEALVWLGRFDEAVRVLDTPISKGDPAAMACLGFAKERSRDRSGAAKTFADLAKRFPEDELAAWAQLAEGTLSRPEGQRFALLIAAGKHAKYPEIQLRGTTNDAAALRVLLVDKLGFARDNVVSLIDAEATNAAIEEALKKLAKTSEADTVVIYFAGSGVLVPDSECKSPDGRLLVVGSYDLDLEGERLTERTLADLLGKIPADTLFISDACHFCPAPESELCAKTRFLAGCGRDEAAKEALVSSVPRGLFTSAFEHYLSTFSPTRDAAEKIVAAINARLAKEGEEQRAVYFGRPRRPLLPSRRSPELELYQVAQDMLPRRSVDQLRGLEEWLDAHSSTPMNVLRRGLSRALSAAGDYDSARTLLQLDRAGSRPDDHFASFVAALKLGHYDDALQALSSCRGAIGVREAGMLALQETTAALSKQRKHALLVVGRKSAAEPANKRTDAMRGVLALKKALVQGYGFDEDHVEILGEERATAEAVTKAFAALVEKGRQGPTFFLFTGMTSRSGPFSTSDVTLLCNGEDGGVGIPVSMLSAMAEQCPDLATLLISSADTPYDPSALVMEGPPKADHALGETYIGGAAATLGLVPLETRGLAMSKPTSDPPWKQASQWLTRLTRALVTERETPMSFGSWLRATGDEKRARLHGALSEPLFGNISLRRKAFEIVREIELSPVRQAEAMLQSLAPQKKHSAEALLCLAVVRSALGRHAEALLDVQKALLTNPSTSVKQATALVDRVHFPEAHYQHGAILLALGRYGEADAALRVAVNQAPDDARAHYLRSRAIRKIMEVDLRREAKTELERYLELGAPLGKDEDDTRFLQG